MADATVRYRTTVEVAAEVAPGASVDKLDAARAAVVAEIARSCTLASADVVVHWEATEDGGVRWLGVVSQQLTDGKPSFHRPGHRGTQRDVMPVEGPS